MTLPWMSLCCASSTFRPSSVFPRVRSRTTRTMNRTTQFAEEPQPARALRAPRTAFDTDHWLGPLLIGPAVLYIGLLVGIPFFMSLYYSVSNTTTGGESMTFVGLRNFANIVGTPKFQTALKNTLIFA